MVNYATKAYSFKLKKKNYLARQDHNKSRKIYWFSKLMAYLQIQ